MPLISFVIPVYNVETYLRDCLESIVRQNFKDFEVCIVNDGSTDGSGDICDEYKAYYPNLFKLKHQPNQGVSVARNSAIEMATGKYIWFVDADDYILNGSLNYISEILSCSLCETLFFGDVPFDGTASVECELVKNRESYLFNNHCFCNPLMIFNRKIIANNDIKFPTGIRMGEDLEFQLNYLIHSYKIATTPFKFYFIREREGSASRSVTSAVDNFNGSKHLLDSIVDTITPMIVADNHWLRYRLDERLKALLQSGMQAKVATIENIRHKFKSYIREFKKLGIYDIGGGSLKIARINVRIYYFLYYMLKIIRSI